MQGTLVFSSAQVEINQQKPKNPWPTRIFILLLTLFVAGVSLFLPKRDPSKAPRREHKINPTFLPLKDNNFGYPDWMFKHDALFKAQAEKGSDDQEDFLDYEWVKYYVSYCKECNTTQCLYIRNFVASRLLLYAINSNDPVMLGKVFSYITDGSFSHGNLKMFIMVMMDPLDLRQGSYTFVVFAEDFEKASEVVAQFGRKGYDYVVVNAIEIVVSKGMATLQKYVAVLDGGKFNVSLEPIKKWLGFKDYKVFDDIEVEYKKRKGEEDPSLDPTKPPRGFSDN